MLVKHLALPALALFLSPAALAQRVLQVDRELGMDDGEITPDGRYGVVRMNGYAGELRVYEMATGSLVHQHNCNSSHSLPPAENEDGVAVTNDRAVVIGHCAVFGDLSAVGTPAFHIASHDVGVAARDLEITPDGSIAAVRGGSTTPFQVGGLFLFDTLTAAPLAHAPGEPGLSSATAYPLDTVAVSNAHAVFLSAGLPGAGGAPTTRVTVFELHPAGGGPPAIALETGAAIADLAGNGRDLAISPDGSHVAIRADDEVALFDLGGAAALLAWRKPPLGAFGPYADAMDDIEATDDRVVTIGPTAGGTGTLVDLFDFAGNQVQSSLPGVPHDLVVTPSTNRLLVRTHKGAALYDLGAGPGAGWAPLDLAPGNASHTSWGAGLDSLAATDTAAVGLFRNNQSTAVQVWDLSNDTLAPLASLSMPEPPLDLAITPDGTRAVLAGNSYVQVIDLRSRAVTLGADVVPPITTTYFPWCDGVVADDTHALAFGYDTCFQCGWVAVLDLFAEPQDYCAGGVNSTGAVASVFASGSASIASNDLVLWSAGLPPGKLAAVIYGDGQQQLPFGSGFACVGGALHRFPIQPIQADGVLFRAVDATGPAQLGGAVAAGTTWNFQVLYRDAGATNTTGGLSVSFLP
jgi:hypothetical protein